MTAESPSALSGTPSAGAVSAALETLSNAEDMSASNVPESPKSEKNVTQTHNAQTVFKAACKPLEEDVCAFSAKISHKKPAAQIKNSCRKMTPNDGMDGTSFLSKITQS